MVAITMPDIDPTDIEYDTEYSTPAGDKTYHLAQIAGTRIWVHYTTFRTSDGTGYDIRGVGRLTYTAPDLPVDDLAAGIRDRADQLAEEHEESADLAADLRDRAESIADALAGKWEWSVSEEVGHADTMHLAAGVVSVRAVEPYHIEVREVMPDDIDDEHGDAYDIIMESYIDAVNRALPSTAGTNDEYAALINLSMDDDDAWRLRAVELEQRSVLSGSMQTARVYALREEGYRQADIAEELGIHRSTVSRHVSRAKTAIERAEWTVDHLAD